jgi:hypothetical protein
MVVLVTGRAVFNPGPPAAQGRIGHILAHVWNHEKESKWIRSLLEIHSQEIKKIMIELGN